MSDVCPQHARDQIAEILGATVLQTLGLKESLEDERDALECEDIQAIESAVDAKSDIVERLQLLEQQRIALCQTWGFAAGPEQMLAVIQWCDDADALDKQWRQLLELAAACSAINLTNGAIIRLRQQQNESGLSLLRGRTPRVDTYGQHGDGDGDFGRQSLAQA